MKKRILFVDDEPNVLSGLQRMLRPMRDEWDMSFAQSGSEALELLAKDPFDVVVSDMRMPGMDGAQLLTEVMRTYPQIVRIVLSGHSERETVLRSVTPTHQYLAKPCDADQLKTVIARASALRSLLDNISLRQLVSRMSTIPSLPQTYVQIVEELESPDVSLQKVGQIISTDVGMTAKVLQLVNSAFFGLRRHVSNPSQAATLLGIDTLKALVLSVHIFSVLKDAQVDGFSLDTLWNHSVATGALAKHIAGSQDSRVEVRDHALMAGLVHDAGKLILAANLPERFREAVALARDEGIELWQAEQRVLGNTHAEVGAYLLGLWGLPDQIVEAVAFHHNPRQSFGNAFAPLTAVHVADALEHDTHGALRGPNASRLDNDYLTQIGLADQLPAWHEMSQEVLQEECSR
jgi:HD-like signal output (HDOD) protein